MEGVELLDSEVAQIHLACGRIVGVACAIAEAHEFGVAEGTVGDPWTAEFHREAVKIYDMSLPRSYLLDIAALFRRCTDMMDECYIPSDLAGDWVLVRTHLTEASDSIFKWHASERSGPAGSAPAQLPPVSTAVPAVVRYDLLAGLTTRRGLDRLVKAAGAVQRHMDTLRHHMDTDLREDERRLLARLASGLPVVEVAADLGYSERSIYRRLAELWHKLGVTGRVEGVRKAISEGLLD